jgi:hypothetical protein
MFIERHLTHADIRLHIVELIVVSTFVDYDAITNGGISVQMFTSMSASAEIVLTHSGVRIWRATHYLTSQLERDASHANRWAGCIDQSVVRRPKGPGSMPCWLTPDTAGSMSLWSGHQTGSARKDVRDGMPCATQRTPENWDCQKRSYSQEALDCSQERPNQRFKFATELLSRSSVSNTISLAGPWGLSMRSMSKRAAV